MEIVSPSNGSGPSFYRVYISLAFHRELETLNKPFGTWPFAWYKAVEEAILEPSQSPFWGHPKGAFLATWWGVPHPNGAGKQEVAVWYQPPSALEELLSLLYWHHSGN